MPRLEFTGTLGESARGGGRRVAKALEMLRGGIND
jgi:hypothetical protein